MSDRISVHLRKRTLPTPKRKPDGKSKPTRIQLYLDIYRGKDSKRSIEVLDFFQVKPKTSRDRIENAEIWKQAEDLRDTRAKELRRDPDLAGISDRKTSFIKYLRAQAALPDRIATPNTKASWECAIKHFTDFAGESIAFGNVKPQKLEDFKNFLLNDVKVSANSAHTYLSRIKTALNQAVKDNILPRNPAMGVTIKRTETLPVYLSIQEIRKLSKTPCANDQVKQAFLFSCFSGLRYSDVDRLTWDKVKGEFVELTQKKTGVPVRLPLSAQALHILAKQKKAKPSPNLQREIPANSVFFLPIGSGVNMDLKKWAKDAKIDKPLSFHKARHSFATLALTSGADIYSVSKLLGHKSIAQTQIYTQVIDEKKRRAVNRLPRL